MSNPQDDPDQGFLTRWSRRKRLVAKEQAEEQVEEQGNAQPPAPLPDMTAQAEPDERPRDPETGDVIDEELVASLPSPADLGPGGDLSPFMRKGVPESIRREALRAMWSADPAIRDFVSPALDYAYDYNAPGGAPGYGPLSASDIAQAQEFLKTVFSTAPDLHKTDSEGASDSPTRHGDIVSQVDVQSVEPSATAVRRTDAAVQNLPENDATAQSVTLPEEGSSGTEKTQKDDGTMVQRNTTGTPPDAENRLGTPSNPAFRRRGGGASPI